MPRGCSRSRRGSGWSRSTRSRRSCSRCPRSTASCASRCTARTWTRPSTARCTGCCPRSAGSPPPGIRRSPTPRSQSAAALEGGQEHRDAEAHGGEARHHLIRAAEVRLVAVGAPNRRVGAHLAPHTGARAVTPRRVARIAGLAYPTGRRWKHAGVCGQFGNLPPIIHPPEILLKYIYRPGLSAVSCGSGSDSRHVVRPATARLCLGGGTNDKGSCRGIVVDGGTEAVSRIQVRWLQLFALSPVSAARHREGRRVTAGSI